MSSWRSYLGGYSPFASPAPRSPPTVNDGDYQYLGPEDIVDPPTLSRGGPLGSGASGKDHWYSAAGPAHHVSRADADNPNAPDILVLRHRGTTYPLHFPAFSIGEGLVHVDELRRYAANVTDTPDPRRVKLLYKGKVLKDDNAACNAEGLKQNSELMCVVTEAPANGGADYRDRERGRGGFLRRPGSSDSNSGLSGSESDLSARVSEPAGGERRKRRNRRGSKRTRKLVEKRDEDFLSASSAYGSNAAGGASSRPTTPSSSAVGQDGPPSPRASPQPPHPNNSATTSPPPRSSGTHNHPPDSPLGRLSAIATTLRTQFVPLVVAFTSNPPADAKARQQEYMRLSESILAQIIFKLDEVDTGGDDEARATRRALVQETQGVLSGLDAVGKEKGR